MWIISFYRFYACLALGAVFYFVVARSIWQAVLAVVAARFLWWAVERLVEEMRVKRLIRKELPNFKQHFGPYGIRIANKAETDRRVRKGLAEVFETNPSRLKKTVEQLEVMDALFQAGMKPRGDEFLLHDLRLKYGKRRLEEMGRKP
jgi:hypothetical protein